MMKPSLALCFFLGALLSGCATNQQLQNFQQSWKNENPVWRGVHLFVQSDDAAKALAERMPDYAALGVNVIIAEVNYSFDFKSHPELRNKTFVTRQQAKRLAAIARKNGIRLIPELDCLGHQSGRKKNLPLLEQYPEFAEPPDQFTDKDAAHLHSWCPQNPGVNRIVFALIDELVEAFDADAFHAGMDEVFQLASENCPRCRDGDPAKLFAKAVNDLHGHIVGKRKLEMLMWGDRLLDAKAIGSGKWEASNNRTHRAIDLIPKDIVICDWHYEKQANYPSVPLFLEKGFRVWPSGWQPLEATKAFSDFALKQRKKNPRLLGYLCTAWGRANTRTALEWPPIVEVLKDWKAAEN